MYLVAFHIDGREGTGGTKVLTGSAADALGLVDSRDVGTRFIIRIKGHHLNGTAGTDAGTEATLHLVSEDHTVLLDPDGMTNLDGSLLLWSDGTDGTCRADLRATRALWTAVAPLIGHHGLHESHEAGRRAQDLVGTLCHTELAASAMLCQVLGRQGTGRGERGLALGSYLVLDVSKPTIHLGLGLRKSSCGGSQGGTNEESTAGRVRLGRLLGLLGLLSLLGRLGLLSRLGLLGRLVG